MLDSNERIRVHIENRSTIPGVYIITPQRYEEACARHPEAASYVDASIGYDLRDFDSAMQNSDALIGFWFPREDISQRAPKLRFIHLIGAGANHLAPFDWLPPSVVMTTSSGVHAPMARDFATMAVLMLNHRIPFYASTKVAHDYNRKFSTGVWKKTLLIIGVGQMGGAAANGAKRLGMRVIGIRKSKRPHPDVDEMFGHADLDAVIPRADFVLVATPLTEETRGMIGRQQLSLMKPDAGLINIGRAGVVDYEALAGHLRRGELAGAVLDVFDPEPLPKDSFLWEVPNLIMTPHVSSDEADDYIPGCLDVFFENVARMRSGHPLINVFDFSRGY